MNKFITEKLGEVVAFARNGRGTLKKGRKGFLKILSAGKIKSLDKAYEKLEKDLLAFSDKAGVRKDVLKSAKDSLATITDMRDTYVEPSEWESASELLEWMGFYTGAALVHWKIISGASSAMKSKGLLALSKRAISFYQAILEADEKILKKMGVKMSVK